MNDNFSPSIQEKQNTSFMEERVVNQQLAFPESNITLSPHVSREMADGFWTIKDQLKKPVLITNVPWKTTQNRGDIVATFFLPKVLGDPVRDNLLTRTLSLYAFYRMSFTFRIQINATQFNGGQLIAFFDPFSISSVASPTQTSLNYDHVSIFSASGLPHVKIQASESESAELTIPFIHPKSYLTTNLERAYNNLGRFHILVMNPLTIPEGAQSNVTVSVWLYATDAEVNVPIGYHTPLLEPTSAILPNLGSTIGKTIGGPAMSKIGSSLGKVGNMLTGNVGQAFDIVGGLSSGLKDMLLDYPADPIAPLKTISPLENLSIAKGKSRSNRLSLDPNSLHKLDDSVAGEDMDAMNLKHIVSKPMLITQAQFTSNNAAQTLLFGLPVHPCVVPATFIYRNSDNEVLNTLRQNTYLSHVSSAFSYWNGGLNYDIEIVATRFHTGKLLFAYVPNSDTMPTFEQVSSNCPNVIIDIQQTSHFTFTIPYTAGSAMKSTNLELDSTTQIADITNGNLVCYVLNHLNYPTNVANLIELNIYLYAAPDFNLYVPRKPLVNTQNFSSPPTTLEETSGISIASDGNQPSGTSVTLSKDQSISTPRAHFGEEYSLIDLIRRFSYLVRQDFMFPDNNYSYQTLSNYPTQDNNYAFQTSYLTYFAKIYSSWCGSIRYKYATSENRSSPFSLTLVHFPDTSVSNQLISNNYNQFLSITQGYASARTALAQDNALEIEVPYYSPYNMLITRSTSSRPTQFTFNGNLTAIGTTSVKGDQSFYADIYHAAGEDFRFIFLRPPPLDNSNPAQNYIYPLITTPV